MNYNNFLKLSMACLLGQALIGCQTSHHHTHGNNSAHNHDANHGHGSQSDNKDVTVSGYKQKPVVDNDPKNHEVCNDFLAMHTLKTSSLNYVGCSVSYYDDKPAYIARYKVYGKNAVQVQHYLQHISNMPALYKDCCSWQSINPKTGNMYGEINKNGYTYFVNMQSAELKLGWNISSDIHKISSFDVYVVSLK